MEILQIISNELNKRCINMYITKTNKIIVNQGCDLSNVSNSLLFEILNHCVFNFGVYIPNIEFLPKDININVKGTINLPNLKSKMLKDLIIYPGPKRQLAFNLLKNI